MNSGLGSLLLFKNFVCGIIWWTFIEYTLHRFVFHLEPFDDTNSKILAKFIDNRYYITFHFLLHGQHHKVLAKTS